MGQIDPRKFFDIHTAQGSGIAKEALERIAELYTIEASIRGDPPDKRKRLSLRKISRTLEEAGHLNERGKRFNPRSIASAAEHSYRWRVQHQPLWSF